MKNSKKDEKVSTLIDKLIEVRKGKGITQANLAEKSGYSQQVISRIEKKINIPQMSTLCDLVDVLGHEITYKPKGIAPTVKKQVSNPISKEIDLTDIPDDKVITYTQLKEYIESETGQYHKGNIKDLEWHTQRRNSNFICMPDVEYHAKVIENALDEIKEMFDKEKISEKRLERIQEDLHYALETFQDMVSDIESLVDFSIESLIEIIDDINDEDDEFDDVEE